MTRKKLGKPEVGTITLAAYQEGNKVLITLSDDGKGLKPEIIKASAEKKGIDTTGMTDRELQMLVFHPGFSTAKKITNISGRGVGLDAVQAKIAELGGSIEMDSKVDVGTTFIIKLPLTLSIIQALMVQIGKESFAIPLDVVERVVMVREKDIMQTRSMQVPGRLDSDHQNGQAASGAVFFIRQEVCDHRQDRQAILRRAG